MDRTKRARPSPAILIAALALVAAVAGTAIAGPVATTSKDKLSKAETKKVKKIAKKKANKQIEKKAPGLDVNSALTANSATTAISATTADSARPFAYARVQGSDGTVSPDRPSRNIASGNISNPEAGVYCFDLPFTPSTGAATSQADAGSDDIAMIDLRGTKASLAPCPGTPEAMVINYDVSFGGQSNDSFHIQLYD